MFGNVNQKLKSLKDVASNLRRQSAVRIGPLGRKTVVMDVTKCREIRTLRYILILFDLAGYEIRLRGRLNRWTLQAARELHWHPRTRLFWQGFDAQNTPIYCADKSIAGAPSDSLPSKTIQLHYDFTPKLVLEHGHFAMPIPMHTQLYVEYEEHERLESHRRVARKVRVFFIGNWDESYHNEIITRLQEKVSRHEILSYLCNSNLARVIHSARELDALLNQGYVNEVVLVMPTGRVNQGRLLRTVASAEFFLCPPGIIVPWCHNIVEAMAVGTIPITNYPEWFVPPLEDGVNCLSFRDLEDLKCCLQAAKSMNEETLRQMRENVINYYKEFLDPINFVQRLMETPESIIHLHLCDENEEVVRQLMGSISNSDARMTDFSLSDATAKISHS